MQDKKYAFDHLTMKSNHILTHTEPCNKPYESENSRENLDLATIFQRYGPQYIKRFGERMPFTHLQAIEDIAQCRTDAFGGHLDICDHCGYTHFYYHSCYNRSCPQCNGIHTQKWIEKRTAELLPVDYYHVVFTLPKEIQPFVRSNPIKLLNVLFKASTDALVKLMADPKFAGGKPGMIAVMHTWTRAMLYHPHVHYLVPGVVITNSSNTKGEGGVQWAFLPTRKKKFLVPVKALSVSFRNTFIEMAEKELPDVKFPQIIRDMQWITFSKPTLEGDNGTKAVIQYLARYVNRVAITNNRILEDNKGRITFKYQTSNDRIWKQISLDAMEFIRRFLQHVLPKGFHKVRYYGFLAPTCRKRLQKLTEGIEMHKGIGLVIDNIEKRNNKSQQLPAEPKSFSKCPTCKVGNMVVILHLFSRRRTFYSSRHPP